MHTGGCDTAPAFSGLHVYLQFTWEVGLPPSPVEFSSHCHFYKLSSSRLLGVCCYSCLLQLACLFTVLWGLLLRLLWCSGRAALFATCLFCYWLLFSFSFFPGWGQSVQGAMLIWPRVVCGSTACCLLTLWSVTSQAVWALVSGGSTGALLVSLFNVKWGCYVWAEGVEEWKSCFFSVFFPVVFILMLCTNHIRKEDG
jgi:hypothetical protein